MNPKLEKLGYRNVPTLEHNGNVINGYLNCIKYIDENFGEPRTLIPSKYKIR